MPFCGAKLLRFLFSSVWEMGSPLLKVERSLHRATQDCWALSRHKVTTAGDPVPCFPPAARGAPFGVLPTSCEKTRHISVFKTSCLIARLHRLPFTSRSGGTFQPSPSRPPGAASPWRLSQTAVPRVSSDPPCSARDPQDVSPRLHG